jgi:hypothetical protein
MFIVDDLSSPLFEEIQVHKRTKLIDLSLIIYLILRFKDTHVRDPSFDISGNIF